ncbi:MAG: hypothetical protein IJE10_10675 [Clostridia bacterium]|nr:hypothetical protein [Clostridia bacterium]
MRITYETHYRSSRKDGRHTATMAAFLERLRQTAPSLTVPDNEDPDTFLKWRESLKQKVFALLRLDVLLKECENQPLPKQLSTVQRDGYRVEKWEFYPDSFSAVRFLALIPDTASPDSPVPGVMCFPGSIFSKEFLAGEPLLDKPVCRFEKYPERNRMALHIVRNGMAVFAFDPLSIAECALDIEAPANYGSTARTQLCHGLIQNGFSYFGLSVAQKLCALDFIKTLPFIDTNKLAVSGHSLGCDDAMYIALLRDEIKAVVFNDMVCDERHRYFSTTEYEEDKMCNHIGNWHEIPGSFQYYTRPDILAALAPKYLALNEGGAQIYLDKIQKAYSLFGKEDRLLITHYPKYQNADTRSKQYEPPAFGLSDAAYLAFTNTDAPDHSFRAEPSVRLLNLAFK